jgi:hypothetical protein
MKKAGRKKSDATEDIEFVGLEALDPAADESEVSGSDADEPGMDSPGDDAVLEQEELYEGISSDEMPSRKREQS